MLYSCTVQYCLSLTRFGFTYVFILEWNKLTLRISKRVVLSPPTEASAGLLYRPQGAENKIRKVCLDLFIVFPGPELFDMRALFLFGS